MAIGELSDSLSIDLDKVRKKYEGLDGTELAISESQERMAVVLKPENVEKFIALAEEENLEAYSVAEVTSSGRLIMKWRGKEILNIERSFLDTNGMPQYSNAKITTPDERISPFCSAKERGFGEGTMDGRSVRNQRMLATRTFRDV